MKKQFNVAKVRKHLSSTGFKINGLAIHDDVVSGRFEGGIEFFVPVREDGYQKASVNWPSIGSNTPLVGSRILAEWQLQIIAVALISTMTE